ncbi:MAG TPA: ornithine cyclodeaminase family protein [Candidatus Binatia bacterium]|jgi:ornithine cyclodeaminase/alanine dehydrogenase-like protein (mu-crystallin family)|nr:ornithine cyclodeaminase family protein [Candidatus Binatia bacterium]
MPLLLSREETQPLLDLIKAIELTEAAYRDQAEGQVTAHAPYHIKVQGEQALRVVSGALIKSRRVGVRLGPNVQLSGGDRMYALLFDSESGNLLSFMGYPFGTMRTAATIAVAAKRLAREDAHTVGLFGVGRNALGLVRGLTTVRKISKVVVSSRDVERRKSFCERGTKELRIEFVPTDKPEAAVKNMDLILTSTSSTAPVFPADWVAPGTHVTSIGKPGELGKELYLRADRFIVGAREHEKNYFDHSGARPLVELVAEGKTTWEKIPELGDLVVGRASGRKTPKEITIFKESQGGFGDMAFAQWIYEEAVRRKLGREMAL